MTVIIRFYHQLFLVILAFFMAGIISDFMRPLHVHATKSVVMPTQQDDPQPDLIVEAIVVSPPDPSAGSVADITVTIKNVGDAPATGFGIYLYVDPEDVPPTLSTQETTRTFYGIDPILPGGTWSFVRTGHTFVKANSTIYAWVDRNDQVAESNETNNLFPEPPPTEGDAFEQDDSCDVANQIAPNASPQEHNLFRENDQRDSDWVALKATAGVIYVVSASPTGPDADLVLEYRTRCEGLGLGGGQKITITATSNITYFIGVEHVLADYGPDNAYTLVVESDERCNSFEPNNLCALAQPIYPGSDAATSTLCQERDEDWFTFQVDAGVQYTVTASNVGSQADIDVRMMEGCEGQNLGEGLNHSYIAGQQQLVHLRVKNKNSAGRGVETEYQIAVEADSRGRCETDRFEQGDVRDDIRAKAQSINNNQNAQQRNICPAGDVDWVKFDATAGENYLIETFDLGENADTKLCLHNAEGKELACDDDSGAGLGARLHLETTVDGTYYLQIRDANPQVAGPKSRYSLHVLSGELCDDSDKANNSRATATSISADGSPQLHIFCDAGDVDWITFDADANTSYVIETLNVDVDADTVVALYDANGNPLATNDDYTDGVASQLIYTTAAAGRYFVKVRLYNPTRYGEGTRYTLKVKPGKSSASETPVEDAANEGENDPTQEGPRTLILFNESRLIDIYGAGETERLRNKLDKLANHEMVEGHIVQIDDLPGMDGLYAAWQTDWAPGKANQIADRIRSYIRRYRSTQKGLQYLILVGDDRVLPFYRIPDKTDKVPEHTYSEVNTKHPTGVALRQNYFLTDDYYASPKDVTRNKLTFYLPELSVGRLIETPDDMIGFIDRFLDNAEPQIEYVLVTGWDFVDDVAQENCGRWRATLSDNSQTKVNCEMIGEFWTQQQLRNGRTSSDPIYAIQSINGHAAHFADQTPDNALVTAAQIAATSVDLGGGLVYSVGCHGGLNVPPSNIGASGGMVGEFIAIDLPEIFLRKGANYIGNTGNGYGTEAGIELSERLVQLMTDRLSRMSYGNALLSAKQSYFGQLIGEPTPYDQKVLQELTFYGLPMFDPDFGQEVMGASINQETFPGVDFNLSPFSLGPEEFSTRTVMIDFKDGKIESIKTSDGEYLELSGNAQGTAGHPVQPFFFQEFDERNKSLRSVVIKEVVYTLAENIDPLIQTPTNEYITDKTERALDKITGWTPATLARVQPTANDATFAMHITQYNASTRQQRRINSIKADLIYTTSADRTPPTVTVIDGLYDEATGKVSVKVGAIDSAGIDSITLVYVTNEQATEGQWQSQELIFDESAHKWLGSFDGDENSRFFAQIMDRYGNTLDAHNKGHWFAPERMDSSDGLQWRIYLPMVSK